MSCKHKPIFKFKKLFARRPEYFCQNCGAKIQLTPPFRTGLRAANALFIMIILFRAFNTTDTEASVEGFLINMGILFALATAYVIVLVMIIKFGPYEEIIDEDIVEKSDEKNAEESKTDVLTDESSDQIDNAADDQNLTEEQKQLMEMYAAYEKQAQERGEASPVKQAKPLPEEPECKHEPVDTWKNYIPSKMDFVCKHCGDPITFPMSRKKSINLIFLAVMAIILMPNFFNDDINFWQYLLITLGALAVATVLQVLFVKKWPMESKK